MQVGGGQECFRVKKWGGGKEQRGPSNLPPTSATAFLVVAVGWGGEGMTNVEMFHINIRG